jgi:uncharacterized protein YndB with AHSA1/START domain
MNEPFVAHVSLTIAAPWASVWAAFVDPQMIERYMPVADFASDWREGGQMTWRFEWLGKPLEVRGTVLRFDPPHVLAYRYSRPIFRAGAAAEPPGKQHRVTIELFDEEARTRISITVENNETRRELEHTEGGWRLALNNLKALLESTDR